MEKYDIACYNQRHRRRRMFRDWNFWLSVVTIVLTMITAITAIIAVLQTKKQIELSNKQHLFDLRIENYLVAKCLVEQYRNQKHLWEKEERNKVLFESNSIFFFLTNNTFLEEIQGITAEKAFGNPLQKNFLKKMESIKEISTKIELIFSGENAHCLAKYVYLYQELLHALYQYQIILEKLQEHSDQFHVTLEEAQRKIPEQEYRDRVWKVMDDLEALFVDIDSNDMMIKLEDQIRLTTMNK